jgi:apolipoprotein N-acyltransferase
VPTARSVNTGVSGFIDSLGRPGPLVLPQRRDGTLIHAVQLDDRRTLFGMIGRWPVIAMAIATGLLAAVGLGRDGRSRKRGVQ